MHLSIASLNSGSNGNCYYIGNGSEAVLVDVGISCREVERRMARAGLDMKKVKAIFISHEHSDHIRGVEVTARKYRLPVYITDRTLRSSGLDLDGMHTSGFEAYSPVSIGELSVTAFPKFHDAADPHSFIVEGNGITIGVLTDIGSACSHVMENFSRCDAAFLEANYDEAMLETGRYPYYLKKRIRGDKGHLSNEQALQLFTKYKTPQLSLLLLSHLSKDNNCPELVHDMFTQHAGNTAIVVASRYEESEVYSIAKSNTKEVLSPVVKHEKLQLSLF